jgi:hypothetical protein
MTTASCNRLSAALAVLAIGAALAPGSSDASTITLTGTGTMTYTYQFLWSAPSSPTVSNDYLLQVPGQYTFTDSFTSEQPSSMNLATSPVGPYDFQDSYRFTIGSGASGDTMVASLGLGNTFDIANLQFRLYEVATPTTAPVVPGLPAGSTLITSWMGPAAGSDMVQATFTDIQSGTYILDVGGIASGTDGGTYIGQLNINPVPLPGTLALLISGLGVLGGLLMRRPAIALTPSV